MSGSFSTKPLLPVFQDHRPQPGAIMLCRLMFSLRPHRTGLPQRHPVPAPLVCKRLPSHHTGLWCSCWWQRCIAEEERDTCPLRQREESEEGGHGASISGPQEESSERESQHGRRYNEKIQKHVWVEVKVCCILSQCFFRYYISIYSKSI